MTTEQLDILAEEVFDYCNANRGDNLTKDGKPGDPRKVSSLYSTMLDPVKDFHRNVVRWHFGKFNHLC